MMSILNRFVKGFDSAEDKAYRLACLTDRLSEEVLSGRYSHIDVSDLQERLADSDLFWSALEELVVGHTTKTVDTEQLLGALMGVIQGLAYDLALDKAPEIERKLIERAEEDFAAMQEES